MKLTKKNYFSLEAERAFMSRSQYLGFLECEARQVATLKGDWIQEPSEAMLIGSYIHSWNEGTMREFIAEHPEMFTKAGELRANFKQADKMILALEADNIAMYMLEGDKERVFTAEFAGVEWRAMVDTYNQERRRMVDLKTTRSIFETQWSAEHGGRVSFIEQYNYLLQAALYCEIERLVSGRDEEDWLDFYIVVVSKENVPDKEIIDLRDPKRYLQELEAVKQNMERILKVKDGKLEPFRCGRCDYCRSTKKLTGAIHYKELGSA